MTKKNPKIVRAGSGLERQAAPGETLVFKLTGDDSGGTCISLPAEPDSLAATLPQQIAHKVAANESGSAGNDIHVPDDYRWSVMT